MKPVFAENSWVSVRDALRGGRKTVAILPCGATEAHGPHLPLNTDVIISETMALRAVEDLEARGYAVAILPPLAYMPAGYAAAFPGTITVSPQSAKALLLDIAMNLQAQGFACLALANSHFDPANVAMLREAADEIRQRGLPVALIIPTALPMLLQKARAIFCRPAGRRRISGFRGRPARRKAIRRSISWLRVLWKQLRKQFFFEKKNQKTFTRLGTC
jgi:creatinine amidohydrolase/Fe(II)-dependent formamide hydrolase-like protein